MSTLHIFNPSHEEALAANTPYYTPTKAAKAQAEKYAALPLLWCGENDAVLIPGADNEETVAACCRKYPFAEKKISGKAHCLVKYGKNPLSPHFWERFDSIEPWGWNIHIAHHLRTLGAPERLIPSREVLQNIRHLSSRHLCVKILPLITHNIPDTIGKSIWCTTITDALNTIKHYGAAMLKAPWSCSGRGTFKAQANAATLQRITHIIERQGAIEVEPLYPNRGDFALEFKATPRGLCYEGISVFSTSHTGGYIENHLASEDTLLKHIPPILHPTLQTVREALQYHLGARLCGQYTGPLGVDMMITEDAEGNCRLHPCIEINLRRTMGYVAVQLMKEYTTPQP